MPPHTPSSVGPRLRRRTAVGGLLVLGGGVVLAGCTHGVDRRTLRTPTPSPTAEPDVALAATVLAAEQRQLDLVRATILRHPGLRDRLTGTEDVHRRHVALLTEAVPGQATTSPVSPSSSGASGTASPEPGPSPSGPAASASSSESGLPGPTDSGPAAPTGSGSVAPSPEAAVPRDPRRALAAVARAEDELTLTGKRSAFAAESGGFARVLASMAAAAAQQSVLLREPGAVAG